MLCQYKGIYPCKSPGQVYREGTYWLSQLTMKNILLVSVLALALLLPAGVSQAGTFGAGESYSLPPNETLEDNLYAAAGDVTLSGTVNGDAIVAGGTLTLSGPVRDDVAAAGGNINLIGPVGGDVRFAGGNLLVQNSVGGDLLAAGGSIKVLNSVTVGKDMSLAGGYVVFDGVANGDARFAGEDIVINGTIAGNVLVDAGTRVTLGDKAEVGGVLVYRGKDENILNLSEEATIAGGARFEEQSVPAYNKEVAEQGIAVFLGAMFIWKLFATIVAALLALLLFKRFSGALVTTALSSFWMNALWGFIWLVMTPVSIILLFATVFGIIAGIFLFLFYLLTLMVACIYSGVLFGVILVSAFKKEVVAKLSWKRALLGIFLLSLVKLIPFIGWIIGFILMLATLGALVMLLKERVWVK